MPNAYLLPNVLSKSLDGGLRGIADSIDFSSGSLYDSTSINVEDPGEDGSKKKKVSYYPLSTVEAVPDFLLAEKGTERRTIRLLYMRTHRLSRVEKGEEICYLPREALLYT